MPNTGHKSGFLKLHLSLIRVIGVIVPRRLRADWRQEWEGELRYREELLSEWDRLNWRNKLELLWRSLGAFWDALWLQRQRLEDDMFQDLRFGLRMMFKSKVMTVVAVLSLALGIGANTAIFSVVNAVLLRPLNYHEPERLMKVQYGLEAANSLPMVWSYPGFEILRNESQSFTGVSGYATRQFNLTGTDQAERLRAELVSAGYFPLLGIEAAAGRMFTPEEERVPGGPQVAVLSYNLWQRHFGSDPQIPGKMLEVDKKIFSVVGVAPPDFKGQDGTTDLWLPMVNAPVLLNRRLLTNAQNYWFQVITRLKPGITLLQARSEMKLLTERIEKTYPRPGWMGSAASGEGTITIVPLRNTKVDPAIKRSFLILLVATGFVLLIACANMANLLLTRAVMRQREFALRSALGASRLRIVRQLLTESVLLALCGGVLGVLVARWGVGLLAVFRPSDDAQFWSRYTRTFDFFTIKLDGRALAFNFLVALATGVLFGLLPALQASRSAINEALKEGVGASPIGFRGLRHLSARSSLIVAEVALSVVLLAGAGLMMKSLLRLQSVNLGFSPENVLTISLPSRNVQQNFYEQLVAHVSALPGVEAACIGSSAPLLGYSSRTSLQIEGREMPDNLDEAGIWFHTVSPDYFKTLGINLRTGRVFTEQDRIGSPRVAVINRAAVKKFFPIEDPIGKRLKSSMGVSYDTKEDFVEVVGVVEDAKYGKLEDEVDASIYCSSLQPTDEASLLIVRSSLPSASLIASIRREVLSLDKNVPLVSIQTMSARAAEVTSRTRFIAMLLGLFAGLALLLAAIGIYGVMAYNVSARRREMGIRIALGAQGSDVLRLMLRDGLTLIVAGLTVGLLSAWAVMRVLKSQLYEVSTADPRTFAIVALLLASVALLACYFPARRAAKVDPIAALRHE